MKLGFVKKFIFFYVDLASIFLLLLDQRLSVFHQLFSWTSVGPSKCSIDKMIGSQGYLIVLTVPWLPCVLAENLSQKILSKRINVQIRHCKNFDCVLSKISLHYQIVIDQRLTVFHQQFSWTSVGPSKCPIDKMIGSQGQWIVWGDPWLHWVQAKNSITENFFQINNFWN